MTTFSFYSILIIYIQSTFSAVEKFQVG